MLFREDASPDEFIDIIHGGRKYVKCLYVYNKIDVITIEEVDALARKPYSTVISCNMNLGLDYLMEKCWEYLALVRIYTKRRGQGPDFEEPVVLTRGRHGCTVEGFCRHIHKSMLDTFNFANVWGSSTKHAPQRCGLHHTLHDEDVVQIITKTNVQQKRDKRYNERVQAHYDAYKQKKKSKGKLKT